MGAQCHLAMSFAVTHACARRGVALAAGAVLALVMLGAAMPAAAEEVFACEDGTSVRVTRNNRTEMMQHPCVKAWFARNRAETVKAEAAKQSDARSEVARGIEKADGASRGKAVTRGRKNYRDYVLRNGRWVKSRSPEPNFGFW